MLYQECLKQKDVEAIQLLATNYDINEIMSFDYKYNAEIPMNRTMTYKEKQNLERRKINRKRGKVKKPGGTYFIKWFKKDNNDEYYFDARSCAYDMTTEQIQTLFEMLDEPPKIDYIKLLPTELSEIFYRHPEKDKLIIFYLRYMCDQRFPIEDWEMLKNGEYKIK